MKKERRLKMKKIMKIDQETLKNLNRQIILNNIRRYSEISRIDLAEQTNLSPTTVSVITSELLEKKLIREIRVGESSGGRKPVVYGIDPKNKFVISIILTPKGTEYALIDLGCEIVFREKDICIIDGENSVGQAIVRSIDVIKKKFPEYIDRVYSVAISLPGLLNYKNNQVLYSAPLHLKNFIIEDVVKKIIDRRVYIFKDTDALILGESYFGIGNTCKNFVYILVDNGVGMSYVNAGKLFKLPYGGMELGHLTIDLHGYKCKCGNTGCIGTCISEIPALKRLNEVIEEGIETNIKQNMYTSFKELVYYSNKGDKAAIKVLMEQAELIGITVANVVNMFNPESVIIGGLLSECQWDILKIITDSVKSRALESFTQSLNIQFSSLGCKASLIGMANEIFENKIFKPVII
jgi:predicted NBD/HSP70 family sugar kinase